MSSSILKIDRTKPFDPAKFFEEDGEGWKIMEEDDRSLALTEIDLDKVRLESYLQRGEDYISGEENLFRAKASKHICLDARIFQTLWENPHLIPESWKEKTKGYMTYIFFDGTVLRCPYGLRCVLCLYCDIGHWYCGFRWLGDIRSVEDPSAVLTPS